MNKKIKKFVIDKNKSIKDAIKKINSKNFFECKFSSFFFYNLQKLQFLSNIFLNSHKLKNFYNRYTSRLASKTVWRSIVKNIHKNPKTKLCTEYIPFSVFYFQKSIKNFEFSNLISWKIQNAGFIFLFFHTKVAKVDFYLNEYFLI